MSNQPKSESKKLAGVVGFFQSGEDLLHAAEKAKDAKFLSYDAFSPYPIHGMDDAMGFQRSPLPFITFGAGLTGSALGFLLQYWTSAVNWPLNVGGKPFNSWPAFVPVMFELTILFAGLATVFGMFAINRLPNLTRKSFDPRLTNDRFALVIDAPADEESEKETLARMAKKGKKFKAFDESDANDFLKKVGAKEVKSVYSEGWF